MIVADPSTMGEKTDIAYAPVTVPYSDNENTSAPPLYDTTLPTSDNRAYVRTESGRRRALRFVAAGLLLWLGIGMLVHRLFKRLGGHKHQHHGVSIYISPALIV